MEGITDEIRGNASRCLGAERLPTKEEQVEEIADQIQQWGIFIGKVSDYGNVNLSAQLLNDSRHNVQLHIWPEMDSTIPSLLPLGCERWCAARNTYFTDYWVTVSLKLFDAMGAYLFNKDLGQILVNPVLQRVIELELVTQGVRAFETDITNASRESCTDAFPGTGKYTPIKSEL